MDILPNKTRVGVGIMKVHCTETVLKESPPGTGQASTALLYSEEPADNEAEESDTAATATAELLDKSDCPMLQQRK